MPVTRLIAVGVVRTVFALWKQKRQTLAELEEWRDWLRLAHSNQKRAFESTVHAEFEAEAYSFPEEEFNRFCGS
jgi:hypothetical protein